MLKTCPDPVDVQDLQFKLHCRLKVFVNKELSTFSESPSLISCASRYGLLFVGSNTANLQVIQLKCMENYSPKEKDIMDYPRRNIPLSSVPKHVCVNCDSTILAVVIEKDKCPTVIFYDILSFLKQNITVIKEARLSSTPGVFITETNWNPALPPIFTACKSDGTLGVYEIKANSIDFNELPKAAEATSFCWSPKGKQIAVGARNGKITQYKPDLKAVKVTNEPPLEGVHALISLQWVSNYQFIGIYRSAEPDSAAKLIVVDAPKSGEVSYTNYEDICYSGSSRSAQFYMILQQHWNILMVASSNSTELGVLASSGDTWTQWIISDSARAELPLSAEHQETLPIGLALDISPTKPLPWNESFLPPCPYLLILSHEGVLCVFNVVNLKEGIPTICTPPDPISDISGVQLFVTTSENVSVPQNVTIPTKSATPAIQVPTFGDKPLTQPQPTYAAPPSLFQTKPVENKGLFGGQTSLTPIKPQQPTSQPALFGRQTLITPISKPPVSTSTTQSNVNINEKYSSIFSALNTPASTPITSQSKPIVISTPLVPPRSDPSGQQGQGAVQIKPKASTTKLSDSKAVIDMKIKGETDALLARMIREECVSLESELKALLHHGRTLRIDIGSDAEKTEMVMKIESLQSFIKEIVDISIGENAEVHYLKQNLIQSWAWFEEAHSRYNSSKDEAMTLLLKAQPLDSATEKRQADITKLMYYIESQLNQASKALDEQWDNFQDYAKKTYKMQMPTMETIFQTMVRQNAILQKQSYILKDIANRLKSKTRSVGAPLLLSVENTKDLEDNLKRLQLNNPEDITQLQYERVLKRTKNLSIAKTNKLRDLLKKREISHVTSLKPQLLPSLALQSPESKTKKLISSLLEAQVSPVKKPSAVPRHLTFVHSTPLREPTVDIEPTQTPPNTPQTDLKCFTFKKIEKGSSAGNLATTASGFISLAKSTTVFNNLPQGTVVQPTLPTHTLSAFVPTTQVTFSTTKPFSFAHAPTTTTTVLKTVMTTGVDTTSAFTMGTTSAPLPKFGAKTTTSVAAAPSTAKTSTPTSKVALPQFSFGNNLSITPVNTPRKTEPTTPQTTVATTKPLFNFGGTTNIFDTKVEASSAGNTVPTTSAGSIFGGLAQSSKPLFGSNSSPGTFSFSAPSSATKVSAFSAVTSVPSSTVPSPAVSSKSEVAIPTSKTEATTTQSSLFASSTVVKTTAPTIINSTTAFGTTTVAAKPVPLFGNVSNPPKLLFGTTTTPSTAPPSSVTSADLPPFSSLSVTTKPLSSVLSTTSVTTQPTTSTVIPTSTPISTADSPNITSTEVFTKPVAVTASVPVSGPAMTTSTPGLFFGDTKPAATSVVAEADTTSQAQATIFSPTTTTSAAKSSIFGSTVASTQPSIFGISTSKSPLTSTPSSVFGAPATTSIFGATPTTTQSSIFGSLLATTTSGSVFGGTTAATQPSIFSTPTTTSGSIFGGAPAMTQPSIFGATATTSTPIFGAPTKTTASIFGATTAATPTTQASIFGATTAATQPSVFGTSTSAATSSSIFSNVGATQPTFGAPASTKPSIFGSVTSTQPSIFGADTTQSSIFGTASGATTTTTQTSIFGASTANSTTKPSIFGATTSAPAAQSLFGSSAAPSTQSSLFSGAANTTASPFGPAFGSTSSSTTSSPFGQTGSIFGTPKTTASPFGTTFGGSSVFGSTPATTAASIFGQPASFGSATPSVFGTATTSNNAFGSTTGGSTFGTVSSSGNVFGSSAASPASFSFAGTGSNTGNTGAFGFGNLNVGTATTASNAFGGGAAFGQSAAPAANPFGRTEQKSPFGGGTSIFGSPSSTSGSVFGTNTGSAFGSNTQSGFGTSTFGSSSTFGQQPTFGQSTFGNTSFGSTQPGPFSSGGAGVGQSGFGSPTSFQKASGFGSPPAFGGSPQPAFGAAPSFGGAPSFGAAPAFGSPNKVFGASPPTGGFGTTASSSTGFGNLASQNTVGFGSLAQQATSPNAAPFSGSSSFSSWR